MIRKEHKILPATKDDEAFRASWKAYYAKRGAPPVSPEIEPPLKIKLPVTAVL